MKINSQIIKLMSKEDRKKFNVKTDAEISAANELKLERELQRQCEGLLNRLGIEFLHLSVRAREKAGWPDLVFALPRRPLAIELKTQKGSLSDKQVDILSRMAANGWETHIIREYDSFLALFQ